MSDSPTPAAAEARAKKATEARLREVLLNVLPMAKNDAMMMESMSRHQPVPGTETHEFGAPADIGMMRVNEGYALLGLEPPFALGVPEAKDGAAPSPETAYRAAVDGLNKATDAQLAPAAPSPDLLAKATEAWAVVDADGSLDPRNVSNTRRAAIINWLVTARGMMFVNGDGDELIEQMWSARKGGASVVNVLVSAPSAPSPDLTAFSLAEVLHVVGGCVDTPHYVLIEKQLRARKPQPNAGPSNQQEGPHAVR